MLKDYNIYVAASGGGSRIQTILTEKPGSSQYFIGAEFPYAKTELDKFLGFSPVKYCSEETAMAMAKKCYEKCRYDNAIGLGVTAVVATDRVLKGAHRVHIALYDGKIYKVACLVFAKDSNGESKLGRDLELLCVDNFALELLYKHCNEEYETVGYSDKISENVSGDIVDMQITPRTIKDVSHVLYLPDGQVKSIDKSCILYPGSFNPLHQGHIKIAGSLNNVVFMINEEHPDKGKLTESEKVNRINQFVWKYPVIFTRGLPLFIDKAKAFPGHTFIIGVDTYHRLLDEKYANIPIEQMLNSFRKLGTKFLVVDRDGDFIETHDIFTRLEINVSYSSTEERKGE